MTAASNTWVNGRAFHRIDITASYTLHRVRGVDARQRLENSPARIAQLRAAVPLAREQVVIGGALRHISARLTPYGVIAPAAVVIDVTATARLPGGPMAFQFGVRNLLNKQYADPLSTEHLSALFPRAGRSLYVKLTWTSGR
jgi:hypothetical protein